MRNDRIIGLFIGNKSLLFLYDETEGDCLGAGYLDIDIVGDYIGEVEIILHNLNTAEELRTALINLENFKITNEKLLWSIK